MNILKQLNSKFILAPMAGITDKAFRYICKQNGAGLTVSEMISAKALTFDDKKTYSLMEKTDIENIYSVQTFGSDPEVFKKAIPKIIEFSKCDIIDINMGCPAPKITSNGEGSALMKDLKLAEQIIKTAVSTSTVPISVKFRKGYTNNSENYLDFAKMCEQSGASMICMHARTREQMYSGTADWDALASVKQAVKIPFIANGDIKDYESAKKIVKHTNADLFMIGRATFGNPFIFEECNNALQNKPFTKKDLATKLDVFALQMELATKFKSERIAMLEARKHFLWYLKGEPNLKAFKEQITKLETLTQMEKLVNDIKETTNK